MDPAITTHTLPSSKGSLHYLTTGPSTGPLIILIHGWPGLALTWRPQLLHFGSLGYHVAAMDTIGYGRSPAPRGDTSLYSCESLVADQLLLLKHLNRTQAIFVGHDWGCGPLWTLAAHHPEACAAIISISVPYRTLELGVQQLITTVNRDIYPTTTYPYGQWDYMVFYERSGETCTQQFEEASDKITKLVFSKANPSNWRKPSITSTVTTRGAWFATEAADVPDIPLEDTVLDAPLYDVLCESHARNGWWGPTAYYLNHARNAAYNAPDRIANGGRLSMPVLHIDPIYDIVCSAEQQPLFLAETRRLCADLRVESVEAGHWANLERPAEVNAYMEDFLHSKGLGPGQGKL